MNAYEQRQEERRERYLERADKAEQNRDAYLKRAKDMASVIPLGQPILVGHHSEKGHRRFLDKIHNTEGKGWSEHNKAEHYRRKAESVGKGGVSSDDPDAVDKLREKLADREKQQELMKAANRIVKRKKLTEDEKISKLAELNSMFTEGKARQLLAPDFCGRIGFPDYALQNNNSNIRRIRQRIEELERAAVTPAREPIQGEGFEITEDTEENRVMVIFDEIPPAETRTKLKQNGFKWSRFHGAWVRKRSNGSWYAAQYALGLTA